MNDKQTQKVTLEDLAGMMQRQFEEFATKKDLSRLETNLAQILVKMNERLERMDFKLGQLTDLEHLRNRIELMARNIHDQLHVEV
ncbi:MAG: hypothetical protein AAB482_03200 [Patescibacteria group bacterium]